MKPTVGRIVLVTIRSGTWPAIVVKVLDEYPGVIWAVPFTYEGAGEARRLHPLADSSAPEELKTGWFWPPLCHCDCDHETRTVDNDIYVDAGAFGWALFSGCEGEQGEFRAFFLNREDAEAAMGQVLLEDGEGFPRYFDPAVVPALLTADGVYCPDDCEVDDEPKLRAAYARAVRP